MLNINHGVLTTANSARDFIENPSEGEEETGKTSSSIITIPRTGTSTTPTPSQKTSASKRCFIAYYPVCK